MVERFESLEQKKEIYFILEFSFIHLFLLNKLCLFAADFFSFSYVEEKGERKEKDGSCGASIRVKHKVIDQKFIRVVFANPN